MSRAANPAPRGGLGAALTWLYTQFWREAQAPRDNLFADVDRSFVQAQLLVRCFYAGMLLIAMLQLERWQLLAQLSPLNTLWPVFWTAWVPSEVALFAVLGLFVVGAGLGLVFSERRWARALAFLGCFQFYALYYSFNAISHRDHAFVLAAAMLVLLVRVPREGETQDAKRTYLLSFFGVQALLLLTYMMTGFTKVLISARAALAGNPTSFHPQALSSHIANVQLENAHETLLGPLLLQFPLIGWLLFTAVIFVELFAFYVAFRPSLHRPYGVFMVGMHIGIAAAMGLFFTTHIFTVALFLVASPFVPRTFRFWSTLHDVPMIGPFVTALRMRTSGRRGLEREGGTLLLYGHDRILSNRIMLRLLRRPLPANVFFGTRRSEAFEALRARYPYLETPDSLVAVWQQRGEERVFVRAEAALIALAASSGVQSYAFVLFLLIPPPLLDWGYRLVAAPGRLRRLAHQVLPEAKRQGRLLDERRLDGVPAVGVRRAAESP